MATGTCYWDLDAENFIGIVPADDHDTVAFVVTAGGEHPITVRLQVSDVEKLIEDLKVCLRKRDR